MNTIACYVGTVLIWGSSWLAIKYQLGVVAPQVSLAYRFALASLLLIGWCLARNISLRFNWRDHVFLALLGLTLFSTNYLLLYFVTFDLTTGLVAVIFSTITIMNMFNSVLFLGRRIEKQTLIGAAMGLTGMVLIFWPEIERSGQITIGVISLGIVGTYSASIGHIVSARNQSRGLGVVPANAIGMLYGTVLLLGFAWLSGVPYTFDPSGTYILSLIYLAVFASAIAFGLFLTLVGRIGPGKAAYATVLFPIVALALSTSIEGYQWQVRAVAGVALVLMGNVAVLGTREHLRAAFAHFRKTT